MMQHYRIFDLAIASDLALPELMPANELKPVATLRQVQSLAVSGYETAFEWSEHDGTVICTVSRKGRDYCYDFPGHARFQILSCGLIHCFREEECSEQQFRHFAINQVVPRFIGSNGHIVLHASAVKMPSGQTVVFVGQSGWGKSTLAAAFHMRGAALLADDCILLRKSGGKVQAVGLFPGIRLAKAALQRVIHSASADPGVDEVHKKQFVLSSDASAIEASDLAAVFDITPPPGDSNEVSIQPLKGADAMMPYLHRMFSIDPSLPDTSAANFVQVGRINSPAIPTFNLSYPRDIKRLDEVTEAVLTLIRTM